MKAETVQQVTGELRTTLAKLEQETKSVKSLLKAIQNACPHRLRYHSANSRYRCEHCGVEQSE